MQQNKIDIGIKIKEVRRRLRLTQETLAQRLGVSFTSVNRWENGQTQPSPLARRKIEELFELNTQQTTTIGEAYHADKK